jgi:hypothetical protein
MKISFIDFWGAPKAFNPHNNFLIHSILAAKENIAVTGPHEADLIIYGEFGESHRYYNCRKFCFIGENKRPSDRYDQAEYSLSSDYDDYGGRNFRIPLWYFYVDWFNVRSYDNPDWLIPLDYFDRPNQYSSKPKDKFCAIMYNSPFQNRVDTVNKMNQYKPVGVYGGAGIRIADGEDKKMEVISDYKFSICYEGTIHPGWYTEKLLHARTSGNIPIYNSDNEKWQLEFNPECCINLKDFESIDALVEKVIEVDNDDRRAQKILSSPTFSKQPSIDHVIEFFAKVL